MCSPSVPSSERCTPTKKPTARPSRCHWMGDSVLKQSVISNSMPPSRWANRLSFKDPGTGWGPGSAEGRMTAVTACRTCGTEPLENARFCHGCGSPVDEVDTRAEYKQVTVLFADVVHSMDIAAALGPERLREIMADLVDRAVAAVQHYGGT